MCDFCEKEFGIVNVQINSEPRLAPIGIFEKGKTLSVKYKSTFYCTPVIEITWVHEKFKDKYKQPIYCPFCGEKMNISKE